MGRMSELAAEDEQFRKYTKMIDENIVYIGDEVRPLYGKSRGQQWVVYGSYNVIETTLDTGRPPFAWATPDGKPVTGFGGAKITAGEWVGAGWIGRIQKEDVRGRQGNQQDAIEIAMLVADTLYGPWQRPFTEADLKRRGLLT